MSIVEDAEELYNYEPSSCFCSTTSMPPCSACENGMDEEDFANHITEQVFNNEHTAYFLESINYVVDLETFDYDWNIDIRYELVNEGLCEVANGYIYLTEEIIYALDF